MFQTKTSDLIIDVIGFNIAAENTNSYLNADGRLFIIQPFLDFLSHFFQKHFRTIQIGWKNALPKLRQSVEITTKRKTLVIIFKMSLQRERNKFNF